MKNEEFLSVGFIWLCCRLFRALQVAAFCIMKGRLLRRERRLFGAREAAFWRAKGIVQTVSVLSWLSGVFACARAHGAVCGGVCMSRHGMGVSSTDLSCRRQIFVIFLIILSGKNIIFVYDMLHLSNFKQV